MCNPSGGNHVEFRQTSTMELRPIPNVDLTKDAVNLGVGRLQVHEIGRRRLVYKEMIEL